MYSCAIGLCMPIYRLFNSAVTTTHFTALNITMFTNNESEDTKITAGLGYRSHIAPRYGLDGSGFESRWGARSSVPAQTGPRTYPAAHTMGTRSFPGLRGWGVSLTTHPNYGRS